MTQISNEFTGKKKELGEIYHRVDTLERENLDLLITQQVRAGVRESEAS